MSWKETLMAKDTLNQDTRPALNPADEYPSSRPGPRTAIAAAVLLIGGIALFYW